MCCRTSSFFEYWNRGRKRKSAKSGSKSHLRAHGTSSCSFRALHAYVHPPLRWWCPCRDCAGIDHFSECEAWRPTLARRTRVRTDSFLRLVVKYHETFRSLGARIQSVVEQWAAPTVGLIYELGHPQVQVAYRSAGRNVECLVRPSTRVPSS